MGILADFETAMAGLDDSVAPVATAEKLLRASGEVERQLQIDRTRLIAILDRASAEGDGVSAEEALTDSGMSGSNARSEAQRARTHQKLADSLPDDPEQSPRQPLRLPEINPENLAALSRAEKSLSLPAEQELFAQHRPALAVMAQDLDPTTFKVRLKALVDRIRAEVASTTEDRHRAKSEAKSWIDRDGMRHIHAAFDRERGDAIWDAIERGSRALAANADASDGEPLHFGPKLSAEAMFQIAMRSHNPASATARPLIGVFVDVDTLEHGQHDATLLDRMGEPGSHVSDDTLRRYLCDCDLQAITTADGLPLAVGRKFRTATVAQRLALRSIYDTCAFPGCDVIFDWCHVHHLDWWEHGGRTDLDNLAPLCSRHHHLAHEGGWQMKLTPDRELRAWRPDGKPHAAATPHGPVTRWRSHSRDADDHDHRGADHHTRHREPDNN